LKDAKFGDASEDISGKSVIRIQSVSSGLLTWA